MYLENTYIFLISNVLQYAEKLGTGGQFHEQSEFNLELLLVKWSQIQWTCLIISLPYVKV